MGIRNTKHRLCKEQRPDLPVDPEITARNFVKQLAKMLGINEMERRIQDIESGILECQITNN